MRTEHLGAALGAALGAPLVVRQEPAPPPPPPLPGAPGAPDPSGPRERRAEVRVETDDGRAVTFGPEGIVVRRPDGTAATTVPPSDALGFLGVPEAAMTVAIGFFVTLVLLVVGLPLARAVARRMDRAPVRQGLDSPLRDELAALNRAVESLAVDVERVAEGQRWMTRQLAGQASPAADAGPARPAAATPPDAGRAR